MAAPKKASAAAQPKPKVDAPTATYVVGACPVHHDGELYVPGDELELTEPQALRLGALVAPAATPLPTLEPKE